MMTSERDDFLARKSNSQIMRESRNWAEKRKSEIFQTDNFRRLGKEQDYVFQSLAFISKAAREISLAVTAIPKDNRVPLDLINKMKSISQTINEVQEELRLIK